MTLRELIDRLEDISFYGRNDNLEVHGIGNDDMIDMDVVDANIVQESAYNNFTGKDYVELKLR